MTENSIRERIWLIADGIPLKLDNMTVRATDSRKLLVTGWTRTVHFENIIKRQVLEELDSLKDAFMELKDSFSELEGIIKNNNLIVEYHIAYDDAGKAGIGLCSEIGGQLSWYIS